MGTKCDGDHLSMGTNCLGDLMSLGTKWTGTICPSGPNGSGDQVSWGPNVSQPNKQYMKKKDKSVKYNKFVIIFKSKIFWTEVIAALYILLKRA